MNLYGQVTIQPALNCIVSEIFLEVYDTFGFNLYRERQVFEGLRYSLSKTSRFKTISINLHLRFIENASAFTDLDNHTADSIEKATAEVDLDKPSSKNYRDRPEKLKIR